MFPFPHTGRARLYVRAGHDHEQAAELAARLVELGVPESAIHEVRHDFDVDNDDGSSARRHEILDDAEAGRFEILVVGDLDQISDEPVELARTLIQLDNAGVTVISMTEAFCSDATLTNQFFPTTVQHKEH